MTASLLPETLLNPLNEMAQMSLLAEKGDWEAVKKLDAHWLDNFNLAIAQSTGLTAEQTQLLIKSLQEQVAFIIEKAQQDMTSLQQNRQKERQSLD